MSAQHCIHYSSFGGPKCALGIDIEANFRPKYPCWTGNTPPESSGICPQFMAPTPEQLAERDREFAASTTRMLLALVTVSEWEDAQSKPHIFPMRGESTCPCCEKRLRIHIDQHHVYAKCDTDKCVNFRGNRRGIKR